MKHSISTTSSYHLPGWIFLGCILGLLLVYMVNLGLNSIWTPNEAFYAEAVREMQESGNYLDIYYNYEPRLRKPPLTYWLAAASAKLFGLSETTLRLAITFCGLGTILITYLLSSSIHGKTTGLWAALIMAFSAQFVGNARYVSPEVPLCFFFSLSMYLFHKGFQQKKPSVLWAAYLTLALVALTKGFPFIILAGSIIGVYFLLRSLDSSANQKFRSLFKDLILSRLLPGLILALLVGGLWYLYAYHKFGEAFLEAQFRETWSRAFHEKRFQVGDLFFYPVVLLWGFLPYSLLFYVGLGKLVFDKIHRRAGAFELSWFAVTILLFTIASGKIPTYMIPAHPAMAIITASYITRTDKFSRLAKAACLIPSALLTLAAILFPILLSLSWWITIIGVFPFIIFWRQRSYLLFPYTAAIAVLFVFGTFVLPVIEAYRPYRDLGLAIQEHTRSADQVLVEERIFHNLPYYSRRKIHFKGTTTEIKQTLDNFGLVLVKDESLNNLENIEIVWSGTLYVGKSESRLGIVLKHIYYAKKGDFRAFKKYALVRRIER